MKRSAKFWIIVIFSINLILLIIVIAFLPGSIIKIGRNWEQLYGLSNMTEESETLLTEESETLSKEEAELLYMDLEKTHKPTPEDFELVDVGMTVQEAVYILGKPHELMLTGVNVIDYKLSWTSTNGETFVLIVAYILPSEQIPSIESIMKEHVVLYKTVSSP